MEARRLDVPPERALIASGEVSEEFYYRALARHLGLHFGDRDLRIADEAAFPQSIHAGVAPLESPDGEPEWLFAPQGEVLSGLFELVWRGRLPRGQIVITSPSILSAAVREKFAGRLAATASGGLGSHDASLSARSPATRLQTVAGAAFGFLLPFGLAFGGPGWAAVCAVCGVLMSGGILLRLFATALADEPAPDTRTLALTDFELPVYTIAVALYREAGVVSDLVRALEQIDYPSIMAQLPQDIQ